MYKDELRTLRDWEPFLLKESGLPGPRGNLELAQAAADLGSPRLLKRYRALGPIEAPVNSPMEFLAFCGVLGLGKSLGEGDQAALDGLRQFASDSRWRIREAVAMALQRWGDVDMKGLLKEMGAWSQGGRLEQRAAVAALCEPRLLRQPRPAERTLKILDAVTATLPQAPDKRSESFKVLRKTLGYGWSVATAAHPTAGKPMLERWFKEEDSDVRQVMKENLRKNRLQRMDPKWTEAWAKRLGVRS